MGSKKYTQISILKGHTNSVKSLCLSKDQLKLYSGSNDFTIIIWNTTNY